MIKRLTIWHVQHGASRQEALDYWKDVHAPLVRRVPGVRRYVQDHCMVSPQGRETPYTGLGEVWFDSLDAASAAIETPEWAAVIKDAGTFMDMDEIVAAWAEEHVMF